MTGTEYFYGLILLILGFNLGLKEASKGLTIDDMKKMIQPIVKKLRK